MIDSMLAPVSPLSLPARGARIEIEPRSNQRVACTRRSPQGERGLKFPDVQAQVGVIGRSPQGERGLKFQSVGGVDCFAQSLPARGARIEMKLLKTYFPEGARRSPQGERGLK